MTKVGRSQVESFLSDVRRAIENNQIRCIESRAKFKATMEDLELFPSEIPNIIYNLNYYNYRNGPEIDYDYPESDNLWVFKAWVKHQLIYIKMKVEYQTGSGVKVISFHIDQPKKQK